jgi:hypothetical protein
MIPLIDKINEFCFNKFNVKSLIESIVGLSSNLSVIYSAMGDPNQ